MKKIIAMMLALSFIVIITACSNDTENTTMDSATDMATEEFAIEKETNSITGTNDSTGEEDAGDSEAESTEAENDGVSDLKRKVIYTANLHIEVKDYQQALNDIESMITKRGGYIVNSNTFADPDGGVTSGDITVRIPGEQLQEFIQSVEEGSSKVLESSISGEDVTEEYVDLESRLKSKRVVEERLLSFMDQAETTEDLLAISDDLATVQGEIDLITGRMNYLQNKADLATVTIDIREDNLKISGINNDELNTWEKTKQQFMKSINFLLSALSSLFIFLIGNIPVFILIGVIGLIVLWIVRYRRKNRVD